jgi:osmotically-inducible protein OsmY
VTTRLGKISLKNPSLKNVEVKMDGDVLILSGKVETAEQSRLAAILVRQEPGVKEVRNDLQVEKPSVTE